VSTGQVGVEVAVVEEDTTEDTVMVMAPLPLVTSMASGAMDKELR